MSERQCTATNRNGNPCQRAPIVGANVCWTHGGATRQVQRKAAERRLELQLLKDAQARSIEPVSDPVAWYASVAGEVALFLELCRERLAQLDRIESFDDKGREDVRASISLYERALDRAERTGDHMISRGIDLKLAARNEEAAAWLVANVGRLVAAARERPDVSASALLLELVGAS